jgi:hypothetical protein
MALPQNSVAKEQTALRSHPLPFPIRWKKLGNRVCHQEVAAVRLPAASEVRWLWGAVRRVAWRTPNHEEHSGWRQQAEGLGVKGSRVRDRPYFRS